MAEDTNFPGYGEELTDEQLVAWEGRCYAASRAHFEAGGSDGAMNWREHCKVMSALYGGSPYTKRDLQWMEETKKPPVSLNYTRNAIESLVGADLEDRAEARFDPAPLDSPLMRYCADGWTQLVRIEMERCRGYQQQNTVLFHLLLYGYGWAEGFIDPSRMPVLPILKAVHPLEMNPDPDALERNLEDSRWLIRERVLPFEEAQSRWPKKREELESLMSTAGREGFFSSMPLVGRAGGMGSVARGGQGGPANRSIKLREFQYYRTEPRYRLWDGTRFIEKTEKEFERYAEANEVSDRGTFVYPARRHYRAWVARPGAPKAKDGVILGHEPLDGIKGFTYKCATGSPHYVGDDEPRMICFGLAKTVHDAQNVMNRAVSNMLEYMGRANKGGGLLEENALPAGANIDDFLKARSTVGGWAMVADDAIASGRIKEASLPPFPAAFERLFSFLATVFGDIGVSAQQRAATTEGYQSEAFLTSQQRTTMVVFATIFENLRNLREECGRLLAQLTRTDVPAAVIDRLLEGHQMEGVTFQMGQDPETGEPVEEPIASASELLRQEEPLELGITVDTGQYSPSVRKAIVAMFMQHGNFKDLGVPPHLIFLPLIDFMELPEAIKEQMKGGINGWLEEQAASQTLEGLEQQMSQLPPEQIAGYVEHLIQKFNLMPPPGAPGAEMPPS